MRSSGPLIVHITQAPLLEAQGLSSKRAEGMSHDYQPATSLSVMMPTFMPAGDWTWPLESLSLFLSGPDPGSIPSAWLVLNQKMLNLSSEVSFKQWTDIQNYLEADFSSLLWLSDKIFINSPFNSFSVFWCNL